MRRFGSESMMSMMDRLGMDDSQPIQSKMITRAVESAQKRVEGNNFDARKQLLQYDDVLRQQREIIYKQRDEVLESENLRENVEDMIQQTITRVVQSFTPEEELPEDWNLEGLVDWVKANILDEADDFNVNDLRGKESDEIIDIIWEKAKKRYDEKEAAFGEENMREFERVIVLRAVDTKWMDHIDAMDHLRQGIHLRAYGQTDPLREYQLEGYTMFENMIASIQEEVTKYIMKAEIQNNLERQEVAVGEAVQPKEGDAQTKKKPVRKAKEVGRNEPCPCGSGKKYKHCCGR